MSEFSADRQRMVAVDPEAGTAPPAVDPRMLVVLRIEWTLLALRYLALLGLVGYYATGITPEYSPDLRVVTIAALLHNAFAHYVLYTEKYPLFLTPLNLCVHLADVSIMVGLTGAEESPIALLYLVVIIGYCVYTPDFLNALGITLVCCSAYAFTVLIRWLILGMNLDYPPIGLQLTVLVVGGWLIGTLGDALRQTKKDVQNQAKALASSETTMRTILDSVAQPIVVYGDNEFITYANGRACQFLGLAREEVLGQRFRSFLFDDGTFPNKLAALRARGEFQGEVIVVAPDQDERTVSLLVRSFIRHDRRLFVAMLHDITEQKDLQEASRMATIQLERVNRELQRVNEMRMAFFATISQRLRSPLSAILGFTDLMLNEELGEMNAAQRRALLSCRRSVLRVFSLVDEPYRDGGSIADPIPANPGNEKQKATASKDTGKQ